MQLIIIREVTTYKGSIILDKLSKDAKQHNKNYLYLPFYRKFGVSKKDIETFNLTYKLAHNIDFLKNIEHIFNINDPFSYEKCDLNVDIENGYMQLLNIIYQVVIYNPDIVIIDDFRKNFHPLTEYSLLRLFEKTINIDHLIITTSTRYILDKYPNHFPDESLYNSIYKKIY